MLRFLFPRLTAAPERGAELFAAVTSEARKPHWYVEGGVPDDLDGRFRVLATIAALVTVRLEQLGGNRETVALTERFIEVMESEHRELGLGDPTLGKTVRRLVGALGRRVELWRPAVAGESGWDETARDSLYKHGAAPEAVEHCSAALRALWRRLDQADVEDISDGRIV